MLILAVDTSTRSGSLAILRDQSLLCEPVLLPDAPHSIHFLRQFEAVAAAAGVSPEMIDLFAVAAGPGSFTGLRVGLTAVMAWAEVYAKPVVAVSSLEAIAASAKSAAPGVPVVAMFDARRGQIFGGIYVRSVQEPSVLQRLTDDVVIEIGEFLSFVKDKLVGQQPVFATPAPEVIAAAIAASPFASASIEAVPAVLALAVGHIGYSKALRGEFVDALHLEANYVRRPEAEVNWKGL